MSEDDQVILKIDGEVASPRDFTFRQLSEVDHRYQLVDVSSVDPSRHGDAVRLEGLLEAVGARESAKFLGLHSSHDNFHASIPLTEVRDRGFVIYRLDGRPLPLEKGGPARFYIPDHASCKTDEIDECANVKFVDHIELTAEKGFDNRPQDEVEHAKLHDHE
jgi:DMSO/TMAO reductase YedYZ molybdopterin-dependent catalytic subunit